MGKFDNFDRDQLIALLSESERALQQAKDSETQHLVEDLRVHQIELEMQNRELRESQQVLEEARDRYAELYDFAPVGYVSISRTNVIRNINLTGARMLGQERFQLVDKPITLVLSSRSAAELRRHTSKAFDSAQALVTEVTILTRDQEITRDMRLDSSIRTSSDGDTYCFTVMTDITERKQAQRALLAERDLQQKIIDGVEDPVLVIDTHFQVQRMNRVARDLAKRAGYDPDDVHCYELLHRNERPCSTEIQPCPLKTVQETRQPCKVMHDHFSTTGEVRKFEVMATPLSNEQGQFRYIVETAHDVTEHLELMEVLKERELSYAHLAQHDPLTTLPNRLLFADRLNQAMHVAHRNRTRLAVLFIDLDQFKQINDSLGHAFGDQVLKAVACRLQELFREDDTIARMGGDEFTVILTDIGVDENSALVARKILKLFKTPFEISDQTVYLGASIGISLYPEHGDNVDELVRNADTAMYRAKEQGRGTFQYYSRELTDRAFQRVQLESSLHDAVKRNELLLYYQPQLDLNSLQLTGIEALVRWEQPGVGVVSPAAFIALAEETEIIVEMGRWILGEACRQMKHWIDNGVIGADCTVSVNISSRQFGNDQLLATVQEALDSTGLAPANLELEITESTMMLSTEATAEMLVAFRRIGIKIAIDDFGTGYSSLNYLKQLPLTRLKIDQSFISDIPTDHHDVAIARTIIALGKNLSLDVLAEGIETAEQLAFLQAEGCNSGQGYHFSYPLPPDALKDYLLAIQQ